MRLRFEEWWPWYEEIYITLGYHLEGDRSATQVLSELLKGRPSPLGLLRRLVRGREIIVYGAGPSLVSDISLLEKQHSFYRRVHITADGATSGFVEELGMTPDVIVSDMDGRLGDLREANRRGAVMVVHGHSDNIRTLKKEVPRFAGPMVGTTQVEPAENVYNFGGFTDGDRAAFLAEWFGARRIILAGMDLGYVAGYYSKPSFRADVMASREKRLKMEIARQLLSWLASWSDATIENATSGGTGIQGIQRILPIAEGNGDKDET